MERRMLLALALCFALIWGYPLVIERFFPEKFKTAPGGPPPGTPVSSKASPPAAVKASPAGLQSGEAVEFSKEEDVLFDNEKISLFFNRKSGSIRQMRLKHYRNPRSGEPLLLFSLERAGGAPLSVSVMTENAALSPSDYSADILGNVILMKSNLPDGVLVSKNFEINPAGYEGRLRLELSNASDKPLNLRYLLFAGESFPPRNSIDSQYIEANFYSKSGDKTVLRHIKESGAGKSVESAGSVDWVAVKDRQFSIILKPEAGTSFAGLVAGLGEHRFRAWLVSPAATLLPGQKVAHEFLVYLGPNDADILAPLGLEAIVNFGKFDAIGKLLVGSLQLLNKIFHNYGFSIIALTALINLLLFPMTRISYMSMKRMQLIQPQINKLREQHKKNPEKLNRETMELYKKHKVNPFSGCLPMLLQMPIFIALYVALSKFVPLMNARFLWARDLSSPDAVDLPVSLPVLGNELHILPLIMVAAMVFQQRLTQVKMEGQDSALAQQQKMMAVMMPIVFGFIFYTMPAGLVLYWLTNTVLMTLYQLRLKRMTLT